MQGRQARPSSKVGTLAKPLVASLLLGALLATGCGHVAWTHASFERAAGPADPGGTPALVLRVTRHVDTLMSAPDIEEDQELILKLRSGYQLGARLAVPSPQVAVGFEATRFGPRSRGEEFAGFVIVHSVTADRVQAYLNVRVTARTRDESYTQTETFKGNLEFLSAADRRGPPE
ncbi:hypothetical protein HQ590_15335 [bacterium]|nr:hypothetical protein [bacterium]